MSEHSFQWSHTAQFSLIQVLAACAVPSAIAFAGFHLVLPHLFHAGLPAVVAWPCVAAVLLLLFTIVPIALMAREAKLLNISLKSRMCIKALSKREWVFAIGVLCVGVIVASGASGLSVIWGNVLGLGVPDYFPFFLDPKIDPMRADPTSLTPGFDLNGAYWVLGVMFVVLLLNILVEELYFRAWLLPKMQHFGAASWVLNGACFAFYHTFQLWLLPQILPLSLFMAYVVYKTKSIWPALVIHLTVNCLTLVALLMLVVG